MDQQKSPWPYHRATNRRSFLKRLAGSTAAVSVTPTLGAANPNDALLRSANRLTATDSVDESFWRLVKEQFTINPELIVLNAANLCPSPYMVRDAVFHLTEDVDRDVSFQNRAKFNVLREEARQKLAAYMGASEHEIAIVRNTSEANNVIVGGLELKEGDEVLPPDIAHIRHLFRHHAVTEYAVLGQVAADIRSGRQARGLHRA